MFKENDIVIATTGSPTKVRVIEDQINSELFSGIVIYDDSSPAGFDKDYFSDNWYSPSFKLEPKMYKITRSVIDLSSIPTEFRDHTLLKGRPKLSYAEFHLDKGTPDDELTTYLLETYPSIKRKIAFLIYINI